MRKITLKEGVNKLEDSIIVISGPALAISGIIAGVDLLTGGNALKQYGALALVWAICLLLTLDFQVLSLGVRTHRVYTSQKAWGYKLIEITVMVLIAAAISYVSVQMQSIIARANSVGISVEQATIQLGINPIALTWERSALVLVLIFMSGWFREEHSEQRTEQGEQERTPEANTLNITAEAVNIIMELREEVEALKLAVTQPQLPAVNPLSLPEPNITEQVFTEEVNTEQENGKKQRIYEYLHANPDASVGDIMNACTVSRGYASSVRTEWKKGK